MRKADKTVATRARACAFSINARTGLDRAEPVDRPDRTGRSAGPIGRTGPDRTTGPGRTGSTGRTGPDRAQVRQRQHRRRCACANTSAGMDLRQRICPNEHIFKEQQGVWYKNTNSDNEQL